MRRVKKAEPPEAFIAVHVHPKASKDCITGIENDVIHIKLRALPLEGKANNALVDFLSQKLAVRKSSITIERGDKSRDKRIAIKGLTKEELNVRILSIIQSQG
jgi:uncharacterized protein